MAVRNITIARQVGTGGEEVARHVADALGFRLLDYRLVQEAAFEAGVSPETVAEAERRPSFFARILEALARTPGAHAVTWGEPVDIGATPILTSADYRQLIQQVVEDFAAHGSVVFLGHGAQFMLRGRPDTFRVFISGSESERVRRLAAQMAVAPDDAREVLIRSDRERVAYFREYFGAEWLSPASYDLCVSTDRLEPRAVARLILAALDLAAPVPA
ncbi:cytidylate kinase-like family protein [Tepidiforma sp.]|uniref:cytidylate kinase-like family protein n=1 Tax=Tepidiforma sp. TaxID=2682230 RepID=UPI002ADE616F|nr:cytidylate kinase-like family protein [Tepidiforma sp.]